MRNGLYQHTQIGWVIIGSLGAAAALFAMLMVLAGFMGLLAVVVALLLLFIVLFGTLTVQVDSRHVRFRFGVGLIRRRIDLADVRHFSQVRNPWYYGWGIHVFPGGIVYNVSGFSAIQVVLKDGKRIRIGTDEPEALYRAIESVAGVPEPLTLAEVEQGKRAARKTLIVLVAVGITVAVLVVSFLYLEDRPPHVSVSPDVFRIKSFIYGEELDMRDITHISLEWTIPRIRMRTNGYAMGRTLRGHFRLDVLGDGQLFVEHGVPPYVFVRRGDEFVIVNFEDPDRTQRLFHELKRNWPGDRLQ